MTQDEIQDLIKFVAKSGVNEVEIERKDFKITIKSSGVPNKRGKAAVAPEPQAVHVAVPSHANVKSERQKQSREEEISKAGNTCWQLAARPRQVAFAHC